MKQEKTNNLQDFIKEEVFKLHKKTLLETKINKIDAELKLLKEDESSNNSETRTYDSNTYETYKKDLEEVVKNLAEACNKLESATLKQQQHMKTLPQVEARVDEGNRHKDIILDIYKEVKKAKLAAERKLYEMR